MKKMILFLSLITFVYQDVKLNYHDYCQIQKVKLKDNSNLLKNFPDLIPFSLELKRANANYGADCYLEYSNPSIGNVYCYVLSDYLDDLIVYKSRTYKIDYNNNKDFFKIKFDKSFKFEILNKCEYSKKNTPILFRQVNNFKFEGKKGTFMFYGVTKGQFDSSLSISFFINIIYENNTETKKAKCSTYSKSNIISSYLYQIACKCTIEEIKDLNYKYIRILDSDDISGIPYGYNYRLSPIETQIAIQNGTLINCTESKSLTLIDINQIKCMENQGILRINGKIKNGEIKESKSFKFLISSNHECHSECIVPASQSGNNINIDCILCNKITKNDYFNFDQILTNEKYEIMFNDSSNAGEMECKAMNSNLNLTYGKISSFKLENKKIKFNFIGYTQQSISKNYNFALYLYLISNDIKDPSLSVAICTYNTETEISQNWFQVNFTCEIIVENEKEYSAFELSQDYNYDIKGIPEDDIKFDVPRIFNSSIVKSDNCHTFTINGNFNGKVNNKIDFTMEGILQIKYNLKCSFYNNDEGQPEILCVINHKINPPQFFLEEQEIRKGLNDQFIITKVNLTNITCINKIILDEDDNNISDKNDMNGSDKNNIDINGNDNNNSDNKISDINVSDNKISDMNGSDNNISDTNESDINGSDNNISDINGSYNNNSDINGSDMNGSDNNISDIIGSDNNNSDINGSDNNNSDMIGSDINGTDTNESDINGSDNNNSDINVSYLNGSDINFSDIIGSDNNNSDMNFSDINGSDNNISDINGSYNNNSDMNFSDINGSDNNISDINGSDNNNSDINVSDVNGSDINFSDINGSDNNNSDINGSDINGSDNNISDINGNDNNNSDINGSDINGSDINFSDITGSEMYGSDNNNSDINVNDINESDNNISDINGRDNNNSDMNFSDINGSDNNISDINGSDNNIKIGRAHV